MSDDELIREALRLNRRYVTEIVEGLDLCPWAARALREGHVARRVIVERGDAGMPASLDAIAELARDETAEIGLLIYPRVDAGRLEFERFVGRLRERDAARHELGSIPFAMAAFHPDAPADLSDPERLIPFLRRSPDPTIQLVRESVLERVRGSEGTSFVDLSSIDLAALSALEPSRSLRERIAGANLEMIARVGVAEVERRLADILRDRDESYARLGEPRAAVPSADRG
jgi:hypothetical protein